jgi:RimJ/RimL family protein N-acetyltransferase
MATISLRDIDPATDMELLFEMHRDPVANQMAAFTAKDPEDRAAFDAHWERILANAATINRAILFGGELAGSIAKFEMFDQPNVAYGVRRALWGRGIASQALALLLDEVSERPLYGRCAADNLGSIRVLEKCGFVEVARERGYAEARGEEIEEIVLRLD